ncbi:MAG: hypothetical protein WC069_03525 [Candidatus Shapirobacteria bacterium]
MDITQVIIAVSLSIITIAIVACFVFLIKFIQDLRKVLKQVSPIIDDANLISSSIARPVSSASDFLMGFKNGFKLFNSFSHDKKE